MALAKVEELKLTDFPDTEISAKITEINTKLKEFDTLVDSIIASKGIDQAKVDSVLAKVQEFDAILIEDPDVRDYMFEQLQGTGKGFDDVKKVSSAVQAQIHGKLQYLLQQRDIKKSADFDKLKDQLDKGEKTSTEKAIEQTEAIRSSAPSADLSDQKKDAAKELKKTQEMLDAIPGYKTAMEGKEITTPVNAEFQSFKNNEFNATVATSFTKRAIELKAVEDGMVSFKDVATKFAHDVGVGTIADGAKKVQSMKKYVEAASKQSGLVEPFKSQLAALKTELSKTPINDAVLASVTTAINAMGLDSLDLRDALKIVDNKQKLRDDAKAKFKDAKFIGMISETYRTETLAAFDKTEAESSVYDLIHNITEVMHNPEMAKRVVSLADLEAKVQAELAAEGKTKVDAAVLDKVKDDLRADKARFGDVAQALDDVEKYDPSAVTVRPANTPKLDLSGLGLDPADAQFEFQAERQKKDADGNLMVDTDGNPVMEMAEVDTRDADFDEVGADKLANSIWDGLDAAKRKALMDKTETNPPVGLTVPKKGFLERGIIGSIRRAFSKDGMTKRDRMIAEYAKIGMSRSIVTQSRANYDQETEDIKSRAENARRERVRSEFDKTRGEEIARRTLDAKGAAETDAQKKAINQAATGEASKKAVTTYRDEEGR